MAFGGVCPAKTGCRIFAFLNVFLGLLSLYYWDHLNSVIRQVSSKHSWQTAIYLNDAVEQSISENCGSDHLNSLTPAKFGEFFRQSIACYVAACILYSLKGIGQFFVTCVNPVAGRRLCFAILTVDILTTTLLLYGLHLFRSKNLCLLEHTDMLHYPGQQTLMTMFTLGSLATLKVADMLATLLYIYEQSRLICKGETRSKGVRRSDAFRTPMHSRASSFVEDVIRNKRIPCRDGITFRANTDEEDEEEDVNAGKVTLLPVADAGRLINDNFVEINLNETDENENKSGSNAQSGKGEVGQIPKLDGANYTSLSKRDL